MARAFSDRLFTTVVEKGPLVIGVDPNIDLMPKCLWPQSNSATAIEATLRDFCSLVLQACHPYGCGVKFQAAYFEKWGQSGWNALVTAIKQAKALDLLTILDVKRGDIGSTSTAYAEAYLADHLALPGDLQVANPLATDAITINPFLGFDATAPFLALAEKFSKGLFILTRTSNPGSQDIQQATLASRGNISEHIARYISSQGKVDQHGYSSVGAVVGATIDDGSQLRKALPNSWILAPGWGFQGGGINSLRSLQGSRGGGVLVPVSRGLTYSDDSHLNRSQYALFLENNARQMATELR